ncbi:MAG: MoaD/ThiS family protein [Methanosarcinales archaeon]|nr:MoaD/ThiS family protein [Methanosarcinales archaeon]
MSPQVEVKIFPESPEGRIIDVPDGATYEDLLNTLDINQELVILLNNGQAVPLDGTVDAGTITILRAISGG